MINLDEFKINKLPFELIRKGDLIYYEGCLLSHFIDNDSGEHYFYKWSDVNKDYNRWIIFKIKTEDLKAFFDEVINLLDLINLNEIVYLVDIDNVIEIINIYKCKTIDITDVYLPSKNSYYKESMYEDYAVLLRNSL